MNSSSTIRTDWFDRWALYSPDHLALTDEESDRSFTYAECNRIINRVAQVLRDKYAVARGDRVAVLATNTVEYVFLFFATQKLGAI
ncbi:MAG: class I adenylate-forming enzyme family protein, partial [Bacteroidota bacterium]